MNKLEEQIIEIDKLISESTDMMEGSSKILFNLTANMEKLQLELDNLMEEVHNYQNNSETNAEIIRLIDKSDNLINAANNLSTTINAYSDTVVNFK